MQTCENCHEKRPVSKYRFLPMRLCKDCLCLMLMDNLETLESTSERGSDIYCLQAARFAYEESLSAEEWG